MKNEELMKTLILNGSPRPDGDTVSLLNVLTSELVGEYRLVNAYRCNVSPCIDCRYCWKNRGCAINDEMQEIYAYIEECDNIVIASPIYFSELTGKLLDVGSRLQTYFCGKFFRGEAVITKPKRGAVILVGGGDGNGDAAYETAKTLLHHMNAYDLHPLVISHNTNTIPAADDAVAVAGVVSIAAFFSE